MGVNSQSNYQKTRTKTMEENTMDLKKMTFDLHQKLESVARLKKLASGDLSLQEYKEILIRFHGFLEPMEAQIDDLMYKNKRLQDLQKDLIKLDINCAEIPQCKDLPKLYTDENRYAFIYVMEGSRNGGMFLSKILQEKLPSAPLHYFYGMGPQTMAYFQELKSSILTKDLDQKKLVESVQECYLKMIKWFEY